MAARGSSLMTRLRVCLGAARAGVIELWAFLGSFTEMLGIDKVPPIADLEAALADPSSPRSTTASALVCALDTVICAASAEVVWRYFCPLEDLYV